MLISDFTIMCDDCGRKYKMPSDSLDVDYACSERPMGISCWGQNLRDPMRYE